VAEAAVRPGFRWRLGGRGNPPAGQRTVERTRVACFALKDNPRVDRAVALRGLDR